MTAEGDDHWLLGTSGLPDALTAGESQLVIDASESDDLPGGRKPVVDVAARDGHTAVQRGDRGIGVGDSETTRLI